MSSVYTILQWKGWLLQGMPVLLLMCSLRLVTPAFEISHTEVVSMQLCPGNVYSGTAKIPCDNKSITMTFGGANVVPITHRDRPKT